jgi:biotin-[acetyl-CoA-carboxylase] ligase BirA-like protein
MIHPTLQQQAALLDFLHQKKGCTFVQAAMLFQCDEHEVKQWLDAMQASKVYPFKLASNRVTLSEYWLLHQKKSDDLVSKDWQSYIHHCSCVHVLDSTQAYLTRQGCPDAGFSLCFAGKQMQGRGRHGHSWWMPYADGLCFSIATRVKLLDGHWSLKLGVLLALLLNKEAANKPFMLKWPNDVWVSGKKCGGLLVEALTAGKHTSVIIGLGLNGQGPEGFHGCQAYFQGKDVWLSLLPQLLDSWFSLLQGKEPVNWQQRWCQLDVAMDKQVTLTMPDGSSYVGIGRGIDHQGHYQLAIEGTLKAFSQGSITDIVL